MLSTKPIDASQLTFRYSGTAQHFEYDRDTEKRAKDQTRHPETGYPLGKVMACERSRGLPPPPELPMPCAKATQLPGGATGFISGSEAGSSPVVATTGEMECPFEAS